MKKKNYNQNNILYQMKCHKERDADIIDFMMHIENKQRFLKDSVRQIIKSQRELDQAILTFFMEVEE